MRLLFIKLKHIGDMLLLTPTLDAVKARLPGAHLTVLAREGTTGILAGCRAIDAFLFAVPPEKDRRARPRGLLARLREHRYDAVFVLSPEDRAMTYGALTRARVRLYNPVLAGNLARLWGLRFRKVPFDHRIEPAVRRDYELVRAHLDLPPQPPPLHFALPEGVRARFIEPGERAVVVHPAARWAMKQWPAAKWRSLLPALAERFEKVLLSVGPDPKEVALGRELLANMPAQVVFTEGRLSWVELAAEMQAAALFVGVDTAAMHLAAACGLPCVALFGPTKEPVWGPWGVPRQVVLPRQGAVDWGAPFEVYEKQRHGRLTPWIEVADVLAAVHSLLDR